MASTSHRGDVGPLALRTTRLAVESLSGVVVGWATAALALMQLTPPAAVAVVAAVGVLSALTARPAVAAGYLASVTAYAISLYAVLLPHIDALTRNA
jgi:hypothetical protein